MSTAKIFISYMSKIPTSPCSFSNIQLSCAKLCSIGSGSCMPTQLQCEVLDFLWGSSYVYHQDCCENTSSMSQWSSCTHNPAVRTPTFLGRQPAWGNSHFSSAWSHGTSLTFKLTWKSFSEWSPLSHLLALIPLFGQVELKNQRYFFPCIVENGPFCTNGTLLN